MAAAHDYDTVDMRHSQLNSTMTLVGESGGLRSIYEVERSSTAPGLLVVTTEHGPLYLDPEAASPVLA